MTGRRLRSKLAAVAFIALLAAAGWVRVQSRGAPPEQKSNRDALLEQAQQALQRNDFAAAAKALQSVVAIEPDFVPAWFNLAYADSNLGRNDDALAAYRKALALKPDLFEARLNLGILLMEMKQPQAALPELERAVTLKPANARAHLYYGRALRANGQPDQAAPQFTEALRLDPNLAIAHYDLGELALDQKRNQDAFAEFGKAAAADPRLALAHLGMALALDGLGQSTDAESQFEQYLAQKPGDLETRFHLAKLYLGHGGTDKALGHLETLERANPQFPGLAAALGDAYALTKKLPEAEKFYRQALQGAPGAADLHRALGQTLLDEGKVGEAEAEFRAALHLDSSNRDATKGLASSLYLEKRYDEAVPVIEALLAAPDPPKGFYFVLATCYDHLGDRQRALADYDRFLDLSHGENPDQEWQARQRAKLLRRELRK